MEGEKQQAPENRLLTIEEAAKILHVHPKSVHHAIMGQPPGTPALPAFKFGRRFFLKHGELVHWIDENYRVQTAALGMGKEPICPAMAAVNLLTVEEAAVILRVNPRAVYRAIMGQLGGAAPLPALKWGRRYFLDREKLQEWVSQNYAVQTPPSASAPRKRKAKTSAATHPAK